MKTNVLILLVLISMTRTLESFIGKHISTFPSAIILKDKSLPKSKIYRIEVNNEFLGKSYNVINITTNKSDIIKYITINFKETMDISFYNQMIGKYGNPNFIFKRGKEMSSKIIEGDNEITSKLIKFTSKECLFEDKPSFIIWNKKGYKIEVELNHEYDKTRISIGNRGFLYK